MNKKISLLILSTYLTTSIVPSVVFADTVEPNLEITNISEDVVADSENIHTKEANISEQEGKSIISRATIKYVDEDGNELLEQTTDEILFPEDSSDQPLLTITPRNIEGCYPIGAKINGVYVDYASIVHYGAGDIEIEWVYSKECPKNKFATAVFHESYLNYIENQSDFSGLNYAFTSSASNNLSLNKDHYNSLLKAINEDAKATSISAYGTSNIAEEYPWLLNIANKDVFIDTNTFYISSTAESISISFDADIKKNVFVNKGEEVSSSIYAYIVDEENKKLSFAGEMTVCSTDENEYGYDVLYSGFISGAVGNTIVYTTEKLNLEGNSSDTNNPNNNNSDSDTNNNEETDAVQIRDENDNYRISYDYIKNIVGVDDICFTKGQDFIPSFLLKNSNIKDILENKDESFILSVDINGISFNESPSVLSGLSKEFYNRYKNKISRWVHYKSNLATESFKNDNEISFPLDSKDFKVGDTVYLYSTSNLKDGKAIIVGEKKLTDEDLAEDKTSLSVAFSTNLDISDRTFFLTTSKVDITPDGQLPFAGGTSQGLIVAGGIAIVLASGFIILGKRKKKDSE